MAVAIRTENKIVLSYDGFGSVLVNGKVLKSCVSFSHGRSVTEEWVDLECLYGPVKLAGEVVSEQPVPSACAVVEVAPGEGVPAKNIEIRYGPELFAVISFRVPICNLVKLEIVGTYVCSQVKRYGKHTVVGHGCISCGAQAE